MELFMIIIDSVPLLVRSFFTVSHFHSSLIFAGETGAFPSGARHLVLTANIRLSLLSLRERSPYKTPL
jgi:hypothetical protein